MSSIADSVLRHEGTDLCLSLRPNAAPVTQTEDHFRIANGFLAEIACAHILSRKELLDLLDQRGGCLCHDCYFILFRGQCKRFL